MWPINSDSLARRFASNSRIAQRECILLGALIVSMNRRIKFFGNSRIAERECTAERSDCFGDSMDWSFQKIAYRRAKTELPGFLLESPNQIRISVRGRLDRPLSRYYGSDFYVGLANAKNGFGRSHSRRSVKTSDVREGTFANAFATKCTSSVHSLSSASYTSLTLKKDSLWELDGTRLPARARTRARVGRYRGRSAKNAEVTRSVGQVLVTSKSSRELHWAQSFILRWRSSTGSLFSLSLSLSIRPSEK